MTLSHTTQDLHALLRFSQLKILGRNSNQEDSNPGLLLIAGDASDRKFYRLVNGPHNQRAICMQFPQWSGGFGGDAINWIEMQKYLRRLDVPVPTIFSIDEENRCIWIEDLGDTFLGEILPQSVLDIQLPECASAIEKYKEALNLLVQCQYPNEEFESPAASRHFDFEKLFFEMSFFVTHFLNGVLNLNRDEKNEENLFSELKNLCEKLANRPRVMCHRDYHTKNLMIYKEQLYWIDFQDARMGPHTYDVASLLRDSYSRMTSKTRADLLSYYCDYVRAVQEKRNKKILSYDELTHEFSMMALQRNLKALGSFGYLATQKKKTSYLAHVWHTVEMISQSFAESDRGVELTKTFPQILLLVERFLNGDLKEGLQRALPSV